MSDKERRPDLPLIPAITSLSGVYTHTTSSGADWSYTYDIHAATSRSERRIGELPAEGLERRAAPNPVELGRPDLHPRQARRVEAAGLHLRQGLVVEDLRGLPVEGVLGQRPGSEQHVKDVGDHVLGVRHAGGLGLAEQADVGVVLEGVLPVDSPRQRRGLGRGQRLPGGLGVLLHQGLHPAWAAPERLRYQAATADASCGGLAAGWTTEIFIVRSLVRRPTATRQPVPSPR